MEKKVSIRVLNLAKLVRASLDSLARAPRTDGSPVGTALSYLPRMYCLRALGYHLLSWLHPQGVVYNTLGVPDYNNVCVTSLGNDKFLSRAQRSPAARPRRSGSLAAGSAGASGERLPPYLQLARGVLRRESEVKEEEVEEPAPS
eukprot:3978648-Alexandrium_andersonii.AAC.1